jgi:hypothetical protein
VLTFSASAAMYMQQEYSSTPRGISDQSGRINVRLDFRSRSAVTLSSQSFNFMSHDGSPESTFPLLIFFSLAGNHVSN